jgi:hypothetical protein
LFRICRLTKRGLLRIGTVGAILCRFEASIESSRRRV